MNNNDLENLLGQMRQCLRVAREMEQRKLHELAAGYGSMAANKLAIVVARQYNVLPMTPTWGMGA